LESVSENLVTVALVKKEVVVLWSASTWVTIISLALRLSRVKALPELWLALDSLAGSG
jgi:hypothetical protein